MGNFCHVAPTVSSQMEALTAQTGTAVGLGPDREFLKLWMAPVGSCRREGKIKPENVKWPSETA